MAKAAIVWEFNMSRVGLDNYIDGEKTSVEGDEENKKLFDSFVDGSAECYLSLRHDPTYEDYDLPLSLLAGLFVFHGYENGRPIISLVGSKELELNVSHKRKISKAIKESGSAELSAAFFGSNDLLLCFDETEFPNNSTDDVVVVRSV
jgi:hypothetical protein